MSEQTEVLRCECGHTEKQHNGDAFCCACACDSFAADVDYPPLNTGARERAKRDAARNLSSRHARDVLSYEATVSSLESQLSALKEERDHFGRAIVASSQQLAASSLRERALVEDKDRMDWLERRAFFGTVDIETRPGVRRCIPLTRKAIDREMAPAAAPPAETRE